MEFITLFFHNFNVYATDFFETEPFESRYAHMVEFARDSVVPENVEPFVLDVEVDLCLMEWGVEFQ